MNRVSAAVAKRNGCQGAVELYFRVCQWLAAHPGKPDWLDVASEFDVDRATAYRWLAAWRRATKAVASPAADCSP